MHNAPVSQVYKLRALLRARGLGAIRAGTVDDYQGQEEKVHLHGSCLHVYKFVKAYCMPLGFYR